MTINKRFIFIAIMKDLNDLILEYNAKYWLNDMTYQDVTSHMQWKVNWLVRITELRTDKKKELSDQSEKCFRKVCEFIL